MPPCPRGDQDGDENVDDCNTGLSGGPCVDCAPVACPSALRPCWRLRIHHHATDRLVTGIRSDAAGLPAFRPRSRGAARRHRGAAPDPTDEPQTGAVARGSLTETIVAPAQTRTASRDSRLAQYGRADADETDPTR